MSEEVEAKPVRVASAHLTPLLRQHLCPALVKQGRTGRGALVYTLGLERCTYCRGKP